ncbi:protein of unknown function [Hyphomicrobium sp. MC1]|nr:protein of unknown function [Hyphomicrobium sp. MC1]
MIAIVLVQPTLFNIETGQDHKKQIIKFLIASNPETISGDGHVYGREVPLAFAAPVAARFTICASTPAVSPSQARSAANRRDCARST